jgi:hypothetical protein
MNRAKTLVTPGAFVFGAFLLMGCAGVSTASHDSSTSSPGAISTPGNPDNPPVTLSGYVDTSATTQMK